MGKTNHELARAAAEYAIARIIMFDALRDLDTPGKQECAIKHVEKAIAGTYAEVIAELERLRRQVEFVAELADFALSDLDSLDELATKDRQARYSRWLEFETHEIDTGCYAVSWTSKDAPEVK